MCNIFLMQGGEIYRKMSACNIRYIVYICRSFR